MSNFFEDEIKIEGKGTKDQLQSFVKEYENLLVFKGFDFSESQKLKDAIDYFGPTPPIELIEAVLKHYNKKKTDLLINKVPDLMRELGISEMTMDDGTKVKLNNEVNVSNTNKPAMCKWLKDHGHGDDVKNILQFNKGEYSEEIEKILKKEGYSFSIGEDIHYQTLKKIMRLRLEAKGKEGQEKFAELPPEGIAKVSVFEIAKITLPE